MNETITAYCPVCGTGAERPRDILIGMANTPQAIAAAVRDASTTREGRSAPEIAAHLADVEVGLAWRIRQTLSEKEPEIQPFDQEAWAIATRYSERDTEASLQCSRPCEP